MNLSKKPGHFSNSIIILTLLITLPITTNGQEQVAPAETTIQTVGMQGGKYGVGMTSSWPVYGLSGTMQFNETITGEAVLGIFGALTSYGGRLWYRFDPNENYDFYGYGSLSILQYRYGRFGGGTESVMGLGAGAGVESSLQKIFDDEDFLPLFVNAELGLALANFDHYNFSSFVFGFGIRYRFGNW